MISTQHYHTQEPIENLRIHVTLRKVVTTWLDVANSANLTLLLRQIASATKGEIGNASDNQAANLPEPIPGSKWTYSFRWQEKLANNVLVSYIDSDLALPPPPRWLGAKASSVTTSNTMPPHLDAGLGNNLGEEKASFSGLAATNRKRLWYRSVREEGTSVRVMHIGAQIENVEKVLLATFKYNVNTGLLRVTPGFSTPVGDTQSDPDRVANGPALSTYHFVSKYGARYEFALDNESDLQPLDSEEHERIARELSLREQQRCAAKVERWQRQGLRSMLSKSLAPSRQNQSKDHSMAVMCEVVAVNNCLSTDPIGVEYTLDVADTAENRTSQWCVSAANAPNAAKAREKRHDSLPFTTRCTPLCVPRKAISSDKGSVAAFGSHSAFHLKFVRGKQLNTNESMVDSNQNEGEASQNPLALHFRVYSRDKWYRKHREAFGQLRLPSSPGFHECEVPLWRPILTIREHLDELFLGMDESNQDAYPSMREHQSGGWSTSMWGAKCESTNMTLRVRLNIMKTCEPYSSKNSTLDIDAKGSASIQIIKRSVQEILQSVRLENRVGRGLASVVDRSMTHQ